MQCTKDWNGVDGIGYRLEIWQCLDLSILDCRTSVSRVVVICSHGRGTWHNNAITTAEEEWRELDEEEAAKKDLCKPHQNQGWRRCHVRSGKSIIMCGFAESQNYCVGFIRKNDECCSTVSGPTVRVSLEQVASNTDLFQPMQSNQGGHRVPRSLWKKHHPRELKVTPCCHVPNFRRLIVAELSWAVAAASVRGTHVILFLLSIKATALVGRGYFLLRRTAFSHRGRNRKQKIMMACRIICCNVRKQIEEQIRRE